MAIQHPVGAGKGRRGTRYELIDIEDLNCRLLSFFAQQMLMLNVG